MIFRAPEPPVAIPEVALTPFLLENARGDKPAFVDGPSGRTLTYRDWAEGVRRVATGLAARGFRKGDVFAIYSPNVPEYAIAFHAVSLLGGINATISPLYNILQTAGALGLREDDIMLGVLPFFHIYGMTVIMNLALHVGATVVTMPCFDLEQCLEILQKYRVTFANVVPPIVPDIATVLSNVVDCSLLAHAFDGGTQAWTDDQKTAVSGFATWRTCSDSWMRSFSPNLICPAACDAFRTTK